ncbi:hypothetical protein J2S02_004316 [Metabacillus niabensis]|uniref:Uncharacterized protein n=1 Tax=Metabacillus niabensis TaxID=324854 RepID=A0ABT9Z6R1_9BACI|nr:hypothetical protein [Metabacillus niabensis]
MFLTRKIEKATSYRNPLLTIFYLMNLIYVEEIEIAIISANPVPFLV